VDLLRASFANLRVSFTDELEVNGAVVVAV
jgi:hypothetical protein